MKQYLKYVAIGALKIFIGLPLAVLLMPFELLHDIGKGSEG